MIAAQDLSEPFDASISSDHLARGGWRIDQYACIDNWVEEGDVDKWEGRWSDHRAVRVTISRPPMQSV